MRVATSPCPGDTSEKARVRKLSPADPNWRIPSEMFARATPWSIACRCLSDGPTVLIGSWNLEISTTGRYKSWVTLRGHLLGVPALRPSWAYRSAARRSLPKLAAVPNNSSLSDGDPFLFQGRAPVSVVPTWKATKMALLQSTVVTPPAEIWHACTTESDATVLCAGLPFSNLCFLAKLSHERCHTRVNAYTPFVCSSIFERGIKITACLYRTCNLGTHARVWFRL